MDVGRHAIAANYLTQVISGRVRIEICATAQAWARSKRQPGRNEKPAEAGSEKNAIVGAGSSIDMSSCADATAQKEKAPSEKSLGAFVPGGNGGTMNSQPKTQQNQGLSSV
ncbi:hypothetical protein AVHY2522_09245 [Acidovorax sp. SUPP2522]|uniref:hypothetical protein n=1 Tax=unclassified Acidovorax TaxID=2684926 RepID=UPI00234B9522|nr:MULTISPECIES: hypothetical protein [unclassified Acidovorax]WCM95817.1 hypothetical protein M5C96_15215 [Acidovorax sp. GBBC 1281]GKT15759.1 hypothetical protein AVHY2522_09245 [Acidovorax sp. SUPP2522]